MPIAPHVLASGHGIPPRELIEPWPAITAAVDKLNELLESRAALLAKLNHLRTAAVAEAGEADATMANEAAYAGEADPGTPHADRVADERAAAERRLEASSAAVNRAHDELVQTVADHLEQITAHLEAEQAKARAATERALAKAQAEHRRIGTAHALARWAREMPSGNVKGFAPSDGYTPVLGPNGDPLPVLAVYAALVASLDPERMRRSHNVLIGGQRQTAPLEDQMAGPTTWPTPPSAYASR